MKYLIAPALVALLATLSSCSIQMPEEKECSPNEKGKVSCAPKAEVETPAEAPVGTVDTQKTQPTGPSRDKAEPAAAITSTKTTTKVKVEVEVVTSTGTSATKGTQGKNTKKAAGSDGQKELYLISRGSVTLAQALASTPEGYHLPSRAEMVGAVDSGDFDWARDEAAIINVWTTDEFSNEEGYVRQWYVSLKNGSTHYVDAKAKGYWAVYLKD